MKTLFDYISKDCYVQNVKKHLQWQGFASLKLLTVWKGLSPQSAFHGNTGWYFSRFPVQFNFPRWNRQQNKNACFLVISVIGWKISKVLFKFPWTFKYVQFSSYFLIIRVIIGHIIGSSIEQYFPNYFGKPSKLSFWFFKHPFSLSAKTNHKKMWFWRKIWQGPTTKTFKCRSFCFKFNILWNIYDLSINNMLRWNLLIEMRQLFFLWKEAIFKTRLLFYQQVFNDHELFIYLS